MSRTEPPTPEEIRAAFEAALAGGPPVSETGLDDRTWTAIARVRAAGPNPPTELLQAARAALAAQLDGTHDALDAADSFDGLTAEQLAKITRANAGRVLTQAERDSLTALFAEEGG